jgi:transposase InsO family protein
MPNAFMSPPAHPFGLPREGFPDVRSAAWSLADFLCTPLRSVGGSYDNALAESVIGRFKTEAIHAIGRWESFEAVDDKTLEWVDWFNHQRLLEPIGNIPPA